MWRSAWSVTGWTVAFAAVHSLLASQLGKNWVRRSLGEQCFDGWYRISFNRLALATFAGLLRRFSQLPDRELYNVRWPWALPLRLLQLSAVMMLLDANVRIGVGRMSGVEGLWQWLHAETPIKQNPAQGPQLEGDRDFRTGGSFRLSRHPNNLAPLLLWVAYPRMTVRFLTFTLVSALYLIVGSVHEERRLQAEFGEEYCRYCRGRHFYLPLPRQRT
jgi:protein-S-isoprenylcysteine O-methyltransferase Ste14